ncbi:hypothetical protein PT2222_330038 [Paraburkholderia tropica]
MFPRACQFASVYVVSASRYIAIHTARLKAARRAMDEAITLHLPYRHLHRKPIASKRRSRALRRGTPACRCVRTPSPSLRS